MSLLIALADTGAESVPVIEEVPEEAVNIISLIVFAALIGAGIMIILNLMGSLMEAAIELAALVIIVALIFVSVDFLNLWGAFEIVDTIFDRITEAAENGDNGGGGSGGGEGEGGGGEGGTD